MKELDFDSKEDFEQIRRKLLNKVLESLDGEPNAQIMKFAREILDDADVKILEKKKGKSKLMSVIKKTDTVMEDIANSR
jgi:hypothetical protein